MFRENKKVTVICYKKCGKSIDCYQPFEELRRLYISNFNANYTFGVLIDLCDSYCYRTQSDERIEEKIRSLKRDFEREHSCKFFCSIRQRRYDPVTQTYRCEGSMAGAVREYLQTLSGQTAETASYQPDATDFVYLASENADLSVGGISKMLNEIGKFKAVIPKLLTVKNGSLKAKKPKFKAKTFDTGGLYSLNSDEKTFKFSAFATILPCSEIGNFYSFDKLSENSKNSARKISVYFAKYYFEQIKYGFVGCTSALDYAYATVCVIAMHKFKNLGIYELADALEETLVGIERHLVEGETFAKNGNEGEIFGLLIVAMQYVKQSENRHPCMDFARKKLGEMYEKINKTHAALVENDRLQNSNCSENFMRTLTMLAVSEQFINNEIRTEIPHFLNEILHPSPSQLTRLISQIQGKLTEFGVKSEENELKINSQILICLTNLVFDGIIAKLFLQNDVIHAKISLLMQKSRDYKSGKPIKNLTNNEKNRTRVRVKEEKTELCEEKFCYSGLDFASGLYIEFLEKCFSIMPNTRMKIRALVCEKNFKKINITPSDSVICFESDTVGLLLIELCKAFRFLSYFDERKKLILIISAEESQKNPQLHELSSNSVIILSGKCDAEKELARSFSLYYRQLSENVTLGDLNADFESRVYETPAALSPPNEESPLFFARAIGGRFAKNGLGETYLSLKYRLCTEEKVVFDNFLTKHDLCADAKDIEIGDGYAVYSGEIYGHGYRLSAIFDSKIRMKSLKIDCDSIDILRHIRYSLNPKISKHDIPAKFITKTHSENLDVYRPVLGNLCENVSFFVKKILAKNSLFFLLGAFKTNAENELLKQQMKLNAKNFDFYFEQTKKALQYLVAEQNLHQEMLTKYGYKFENVRGRTAVKLENEEPQLLPLSMRAKIVRLMEKSQNLEQNGNLAGLCARYAETCKDEDFFYLGLPISFKEKPSKNSEKTLPVYRNSEEKPYKFPLHLYCIHNLELACEQAEFYDPSDFRELRANISAFYAHSAADRYGENEKVERLIKNRG